VTAQQPQTSPIPARTVWLLMVAVVLAHVVLLRGMALHLPTPQALSTRVFSTRSIQIAPPATAPAALPRRPVSRTPEPRPAPRPKRPVAPKTDGVLASATRTPEPEPPAAPPPPEPSAPPLPGPPVDLAAVDPPPAAPLPATAPAESVPAARAAVPAAAASAPTVEAPAPAASEPAAASAIAKADATRPLVVPGSIRLAFDAIGKRGRLDYRAMGDLVWLQDGNDYQMRMEMGDWIIGKRVLSSTGTLTGAGLAPTRFSDKFRSERAAHFDRQRGRIVFSANTPQAELLPGAQDQLSIFAQLASLVAGDPLAFPIGTTLTIQTAGPRDAEPWVFTVEREEMLYLPGGQVPALKLVRHPNKDYGQKVELWLAPELAFLPARIRITFENGDFLDQQWKSSSPP
jgi:hypothetical protein